MILHISLVTRMHSQFFYYLLLLLLFIQSKLMFWTTAFDCRQSPNSLHSLQHSLLPSHSLRGYWYLLFSLPFLSYIIVTVSTIIYHHQSIIRAKRSKATKPQIRIMCRSKIQSELIIDLVHTGSFWLSS